MDTSAPEITFDEDGVCNFCSSVKGHIGVRWFPEASGAEKLNEIADRIRSERRNKEFDCVLGLSGGVDSAVVAIRAIELGFRPLVVHIDAGWNTEVSVRNVRNLVDGLGLHLKTVVIDWDTMRKLQIAFLKSGTLNQDIPQDHALFVSLYKVALQERIPYLVSGFNFATESVEPMSWGYSNSDGAHLRDISAKNQGPNLKGFPIMNHSTARLLRKTKRLKGVDILNYGQYDPEEEKESLREKFGWVDYDQKHGESLFTAWFQSVYLIRRYGIDKRRNHFASRVISGLDSRERALEKINKSALDELGESNLTSAVAEKLRISPRELQDFIQLPHVSSREYKVAFKWWYCP